MPPWRGGGSGPGWALKEGRALDVHGKQLPPPVSLKQIPELGQCMRTRLKEMFQVDAEQEQVGAAHSILLFSSSSSSMFHTCEMCFESPS